MEAEEPPVYWSTFIINSHVLKGFCSCSTKGGFWFSLGKDSDKDSLLLERSLFQMYIKIHAFDEKASPWLR